MSIEADLPNLGLDSMCSWTCCSQDLNFNGATAVNHRQNHPWKCVKMNSLRICQSSYPRILLFFHGRKITGTISTIQSPIMLCPKIEGIGYTAAIVPWRLCLREGLDHEKSLAHFSCNLRMEPTGSKMMIDGRESSQTPYLLERSMFESPASILVYLLRFLASSGPSVLIFGAVRSSQICCCYLGWCFFLPHRCKASLRRALRPGVGWLPICERNQRIPTTCVGGSHWGNSKNMWSWPYVVAVVWKSRDGQGPSEMLAIKIPLRMKSCPSIHLKAGMGLPKLPG